MRKNKGFTLIEILVVLLIIGITFGFALIAFGDFGASKNLLFAAEHLEQTLKLAQQQAVMENSTMGLRINNSSYQILKFKALKWSSPSHQGLFKLYPLPKNTLLNLSSTVPTFSNTNTPRVIITPSGGFTPFQLYLGTNKEPSLVLITGTANGILKMTTGKKP